MNGRVSVRVVAAVLTIGAATAGAWTLGGRRARAEDWQAGRSVAFGGVGLAGGGRSGVLTAAGGGGRLRWRSFARKGDEHEWKSERESRGRRVDDWRGGDGRCVDLGGPDGARG